MCKSAAVPNWISASEKKSNDFFFVQPTLRARYVSHLSDAAQCRRFLHFIRFFHRSRRRKPDHAAQRRSTDCSPQAGAPGSHPKVQGWSVRFFSIYLDIKLNSFEYWIHWESTGCSEGSGRYDAGSGLCRSGGNAQDPRHHPSCAQGPHQQSHVLPLFRR